MHIKKKFVDAESVPLLLEMRRCVLKKEWSKVSNYASRLEKKTSLSGSTSASLTPDTLQHEVHEAKRAAAVNCALNALDKSLMTGGTIEAGDGFLDTSRMETSELTKAIEIGKLLEEDDNRDVRVDMLLVAASFVLRLRLFLMNSLGGGGGEGGGGGGGGERGEEEVGSVSLSSSSSSLTSAWWDQVLLLEEERQGHEEARQMPSVVVAEYKRAVREASERKMMHVTERALKNGYATAPTAGSGDHMDLTTVSTEALRRAMELVSSMGGPTSDRGKQLVALADVICDLRNALEGKFEIVLLILFYSSNDILILGFIIICFHHMVNIHLIENNVSCFPSTPSTPSFFFFFLSSFLHR